MDAEAAINQVLEDEGLTSDLDEDEAVIMTNWLTTVVQTIARQAASDDAAWKQIKDQRKLGRNMAKVVACYREQGLDQAKSLAANMQLPWPEQTPVHARQLLELLIKASQG